MGKYQLAELWVARTKAKNVVVAVDKEQRQKQQLAVLQDLHLNPHVLLPNLHVRHLNQLAVVLLRGLPQEVLLLLAVLLGLKLQLV